MQKIEPAIEFNLKLTDSEVAEIVSILMEFPAGRVYNLIKKMELQTMAQRSQPKDD